MGEGSSGSRSLSIIGIAISIVALAFSAITAVNVGFQFFGIQPVGTAAKQHQAASDFLNSLDDQFSPIGTSPAREYVSPGSPAETYLTTTENQQKGFEWSGKEIAKYTVTEANGKWTRCPADAAGECSEYSDFEFDDESRVTSFKRDGFPIESLTIAPSTEAFVSDKVKITFGGASVVDGFMWTSFYIENQGAGAISFPTTDWFYQNRDRTDVSVHSTVPDSLGQAQRAWVYVTASAMKPGGWMRVVVKRESVDDPEVYWIPIGK